MGHTFGITENQRIPLFQPCFQEQSASEEVISEIYTQKKKPARCQLVYIYRYNKYQVCNQLGSQLMCKLKKNNMEKKESSPITSECNTLFGTRYRNFH